MKKPNLKIFAIILIVVLFTLNLYNDLTVSATEIGSDQTINEISLPEVQAEEISGGDVSTITGGAITTVTGSAISREELLQSMQEHEKALDNQIIGYNNSTSEEAFVADDLKKIDVISGSLSDDDITAISNEVEKDTEISLLPESVMRTSFAMFSLMATAATPHNSGDIYLITVNDKVYVNNTELPGRLTFALCKDCGKILFRFGLYDEGIYNGWQERTYTDYGIDGISTTVDQQLILVREVYSVYPEFEYSPYSVYDWVAIGEYCYKIRTLTNAGATKYLQTTIQEVKNVHISYGDYNEYTMPYHNRIASTIPYTTCTYSENETGTTPSAMITSISAQQPNQDLFYGDSSLNSNVTVNWSDGRTTTETGYYIYNQPVMGSNPYVNNTVTLSYGGHTTTINARVNNYVLDISPTQPTQTILYGASPQSTVNVTYADGTVVNNQSATLSGFTSSPALGITASGTQTATLTYTGMYSKTWTYKTTTIPVTVNNYVTNLVPTTATETVKYGNTIDTKATATYATGATELVTCNSNFNPTPNIGKNSSGSQTVTLTYNGMKKADDTYMSATKEVTVNNFISSLAPNSANQTVFYGDNIDTTALITYASGATEIVNCSDNYNAAPSIGKEASGTQTVTLIYAGIGDSDGNPLTTTTNVTVQNFVTKVEVQSPEQTIYYGDIIDTTATVTYATGESETINCDSDYNSSPSIGTNPSGTQTVTLTYLGMAGKSGEYLYDTATINVNNYLVGLISSESDQVINYGDDESKINNTATALYASGATETVTCDVKGFDGALGSHILNLEYTGMKTKDETYLSSTVSYTVIKKVLTLNINVLNKTYDGLSDAEIIFTLDGIETGDEVNLPLTANFLSKDAGENLPIILSGDLTGAESGNYEITLPTDLKADITKKTLHVTANATKEYGRETPDLVPEYEGFITGESQHNLIDFIEPTVYLKDELTNDVGSYIIYVEGGNPSHNYVFDYLNGELTVIPPDGIGLVKYVVKTPFKDVDVKVTIDGTDIRYMHTNVNGEITLWLTPGKHTIIVEYNGFTYEVPIDTEDGNGGNGNTDPNNPQNPGQEKPILKLDINNGDILFTDTGVSQNGITLEHDGIYEVVQNPRGTATSNNIKVESGNVDIILNNIWIDCSSMDKAALEIKSGATANITYLGDNKLISGGNHAGIEVPEGAKVILNGTKDDYLYAKGSSHGAGIGTIAGEDCGIIIINGGNVTAVGNGSGPGIGGQGAEIEIVNSHVNTTGGNGIEGDKITIHDGSYVEAVGTEEDGIHGGEVNITDSTVIAKGKDDGIQGNPINIKDSTVISEGQNGDGIHGGAVNIDNSDVTAHGGQNGISGDPINITNGSTVVATGDNGDGIKGGAVNIDNSNVTAHGGQNGISGDPINITNGSTVNATGDNGDGIHGGAVNIKDSDVIANGKNDGITGQPVKIEGDSHVISNGKDLTAKGNNFIPVPTKVIKINLPSFNKGDIIKYSVSGKWTTLNQKSNPVKESKFSIIVREDDTALWVQKNDILYYVSLANPDNGVYNAKEYKKNILTLKDITKDTKESIFNYISLSDGNILAYDKNSITGWISSGGKISANTGYQLSVNMVDWNNEITLKPNYIYAYYNLYIKDADTGFIKICSLKNLIVDNQLPKVTFIYPNAKTADKTKSYTGKSLKIDVTVDYGLSGKESLQYQLVPKGKKFDKNGKWKVVTGKSINITSNFDGYIYIKSNSTSGKNIIIKSAKVKFQKG